LIIRQGFLLYRTATILCC